MNQKKVTAFLPYYKSENALKNVELLRDSELIDNIYIITNKKIESSKNFHVLQTDSLYSTELIKNISHKTNTEYILLYASEAAVRFGINSIERMIETAERSNSCWVYSDFYLKSDGVVSNYPLIEYQFGSIRDDFDFGHIILIKKSVFELAEKFISTKEYFKFAGLYRLRLEISRHCSLKRIPEPLYTAELNTKVDAGLKMFEYLDPQNRIIQLEMESAATDHLKEISAFLPPGKNPVNYDTSKFEFEASIIIPVKNRVSTVKDAINSALNQKTDFKFNIIVIDNHSSDGTTEILSEISAESKNVIHIIPERTDLEIGGCWNEGINHSACGKFSVQLDSDDIYSDDKTLQKIVDKFHKEKCAMVIGSYKLTDFNLNEIPPGIIDHKEWTDENGHNNALRVNGLGAPRAFFTPVLRRIQFPNVSYGEDYFIGLAVCRNFKIGRIFEPIYICRRWQGNTDSSITIEKRNANNFYKDSIRTNEIIARQKMNQH